MQVVTGTGLCMYTCILDILLMHIIIIGNEVPTPAGVMRAGAILINCSVDLPALCT